MSIVSVSTAMLILFLQVFLLQLEAGRNFETFIVEYLRPRALFKHWPWQLSNENYVQINYCELPSKADTIWDFGGSLRPLGLAIVLSNVLRWWWWCQRQWFCGSFSDDSDGGVRSYSSYVVDLYVGLVWKPQCNCVASRDIRDCESIYVVAYTGSWKWKTWQLW